MTIVRLMIPFLAFLLSCEEGTEVPDYSAEDLSADLFRAFEGDTVSVGPVELSGSFTVPTGVTLEGAGTVLVSDGDEPVLRLEPGASAPTVRGLTVRSSGDAAILIRGTGAAVLEDVVVEASRGIGIGVEDVESLTLSNVTIEGLVTEAMAAELPGEADKDEVATHGLALVRVLTATLSDVSVDRFATTGVLALANTLDWTGGGASGTRGTGLIVHGGAATLRGLELCGGVTGQSTVPAYSVFIDDSASVSTEDLVVCECDGIGLFQEGSASTHVDLTAQSNDHGGFWAQNFAAVTIEGSGTEIVDNGFAGAAFFDTLDVTLQDALIARTAMSSSLFDTTGELMAGDGVQIVNPRGAVVLQDLRVEENARVGILYDVSGIDGNDDPELTTAEVSITATGDQLGFITQGIDGGGTTGRGGVTRRGVAETNDEEFDGVLETAHGADQEDLPNADDVAADGLDVLL